MIDLIYIQYPDGRKTLMAVTPDWKSSEVAFSGAFKVLSEEAASHLDTSAQEVYWSLSALHAANLKRGENEVGQPYPIVLPAE